MPKDPLQLVDLTACRTDFEAQILVHALESEGIPAKAFSAAGAALQWEIAATHPIRVQVRRCDLERAHLALARVRQESVDFDWSELGAEGFDEVCKNCGYSLHQLKNRSVCPECGNRDESGEGRGIGTVAPRRSGMGRVWTIVAIVLIAALTLPILVSILRSVFDPL